MYGPLGALLLASALAVPGVAQAPSSTSPQDTPPAATSQQTVTPAVTPAKEGFWGRMQPFARKKWVKKQTDPINDRLTELDEVNAKNAKDIQDVNDRAQAGIRKAQEAANAASQTASAANDKAQQATSTAQGAAGHVEAINGTVNGLDQYKPITEADVVFRGGSVVLSADAKKQLDDLATTLDGQHGYILEMEAHSPLAGSAGLQSSSRLAAAIERYLVTEHEIPVYRMHAVSLGNAKDANDPDAKPIRKSTVHIRLMANSLGTQVSATAPANTTQQP
jgi:outer membrane protein OmpA-like peptidoglycan-associated protein